MKNEGHCNTAGEQSGCRISAAQNGAAHAGCTEKKRGQAPAFSLMATSGHHTPVVTWRNGAVW